MHPMNPVRTKSHQPPQGLLAPRGRRCRGITLLEVVIALATMTIGLMTALKCIGSSLHLERVNRESTLATAEAKRLLGEVRGETEARLLATYDSDKSNDPDGAGTAPGPVVPLPGLGWSGANASGSCTVLLPYDGAGRLREDLDLPELGLPRDLDGDGVVDSADHSADALFLPVAVRVQWTGAQGQRQILLRSIRWRP